ncbi:MAG: U32 family peptidase [Firmicutes bacterium]|nr:U32 family peptidase [Bacillota bacterium]
MHELLVPVGNMECLYQAVHNGADAVYLACKKYGARKFANNFTNEEIKEAIEYCHLYDVKVYVTMNTLVKNNEAEDFLEQVLFLHKNGVDAIIMQDFGMICLVRKMYPNLEIHASTQANNSSSATAQIFYDLGIKRVVFSRELSLEELNEITVPIEKEVFIHGALCISYSGNCLMSSMIGNRSGNRGECAGSCRLPYTLTNKEKTIYEKKYLLSTKELNTSPKFKELIKSDIYSFKIEGRMKSPEYVGFITKFYRNLIDNYDKVDLEEETKKLKTIYNREFTLGHLFKTPSKELMNWNSPNHIGLEIGKVIEVTPKKIKIKLTRTLNQQDGIRFMESGKGFIVNYLYDKNDKLVNSANDICYVDNKIGLTELETVSKTLDYKLNEELKNINLKKIKVNFKVEAKIGKNLLITIDDGKNIITSSGNVISKAISSPTTTERIEKQISKLGDTPFIVNKITIDSDDNIFINIKDLNELRRNVVEKLINKRKENKSDVIIENVKFENYQNNFIPGITTTVYTEEQLLTCLKLNCKRIYVVNKELYEKYKENNNIYYKKSRCSYDNKNSSQKELISDYIKTKDGIGDYSLNIYNIYTAYYLYKLGYDTLTLSVELTEKEIIDFIDEFKYKFGNYPKIEIVSYGRVENMIIKGNILDIPTRKYDYSLFDLRKRKFPVYFDGINTVVLNYEEKNILKNKEINKFADIRYIFYDENNKEIIETVNQNQ